MNRKIVVKSLSFLILALTLMAIPVRAQTAGQDPDIDPKAMEINKKMADSLSKTPRFSVTVDIGYDAVQEDGQKIEYGSVRNITIVRPNKARFDITERDGDKNGFIFDGNQIFAFSGGSNVYATAQKTGTIDEAFDYFTEQLDMTLPPSQLFHNNLPTELDELITSLRYVDGQTVAGVPCDHLAGTTENVDFQIWIAKGDKPLAQRYIITYKEWEGEPQFRAQFSNWNLSPSVSDSLFAFTPPKGMEKIPFVPPKKQASASE
ncbi:MAG TPA: DUF2092 domain-containing protein [Thermodesulfobacteriota bacterium]|nr:DUF2092 domain-containing protein [Thermodesulfobacteriota bacterium]